MVSENCTQNPYADCWKQPALLTCTVTEKVEMHSTEGCRALLLLFFPLLLSFVFCFCFCCFLHLIAIRRMPLWWEKGCFFPSDTCYNQWHSNEKQESSNFIRIYFQDFIFHWKPGLWNNLSICVHVICHIYISITLKSLLSLAKWIYSTHCSL